MCTFVGILGRQAELAQLLVLLARTGEGNGQLVLIDGEPGIGKTRIPEEVPPRHEMGSTVRIGRCCEGEGAPAFWPWMQIVKSLLAEAPGAADLSRVLGATEPLCPTLVPMESGWRPEIRFRLFDKLAGLFREASRERPLVLALEDAHWADAPSLLLLRFLERQIADARIFIVATYRDQEPVGRSGSREILRGLCATRIHLTGLLPADVQLLAEYLSRRPLSSDVLSRISADAEGNPLFVRELVRIVAADNLGRFPSSVPPGIRAALLSSTAPPARGLS